LVIEDVVLRSDGRLELRFSGASASYYRLLQGADVTSIDQPVALGLTPPLITPLGDAPRGFFRVQQVPRTSSLDSDGDQIPDIYELQHPPLNGLIPSDAGADPDGNGKTALQEYQDSLLARVLTTVVASSPVSGEVGVSVNRETVFTLSAPLSQGVLLTPQQVYGMVGGRRLLSRVALSIDRRQATIFYQEPVPAGARVTAVFDSTGVLDALGNELDADGDGVPGGAAVAVFDTFTSAALPNTAVIGQVFASEIGTNALGQPINRPLKGVLITVDGAEQELRAVTDDQGQFTLSPAPPGRFFVHVDGRTAEGSAWPSGAYYPFVGKAWEAVAGKTNNLAGGSGVIYLPLVAAGTLQTVSGVADTPITFAPETLAQHPELQGVQITVPANSLFSDSGARGGRVGIAPVPPDRIPEPLPPGLDLPLVITIQTDGPSNFDRPVPVRFPNLPDPATGQRLPPGSKTALVSFNHDTGRWELSGPMTISADGLFAVSDPGTGVRQPGWHGTAPVSSGNGGGYGGSGGNGGEGGNGTGGSGGSGDGGGDSAGGAGGSPEGPDFTPADEGGFGDDSDSPNNGNPDDNSGPEPEFGDGPSACASDSLARVELKQPFAGSGQPSGETFAIPPTLQNGAQVPYRVIPSQIIRLTYKSTLRDGESLSWSAPSGIPSTGSGIEFRTRYPLNISTNLARSVVKVTLIKDGEEIACQEIRFEVLPNSGTQWVPLFASTKSFDELREPFRTNAKNLYDALTNAGATVSVAATFRSQKRAYLMHMAGKVKDNVSFALNPVRFRDNEIPDHDPFKGPLDITFAYLTPQGELDVAATTAAAAAMCSGYGIAFPAGYPATRHGDRRAVDMTIRWDGAKQFDLGMPIAPGTGTGELYDFVTITAQKCNLGPGKVPDEHCNALLWTLGNSWGVNKLVPDKPHWSDDGH
jgi:hypothetical protein